MRATTTPVADNKVWREFLVGNLWSLRETGFFHSLGGQQRRFVSDGHLLFGPPFYLRISFTCFQRLFLSLRRDVFENGFDAVVIFIGGVWLAAPVPPLEQLPVEPDERL